MLTPLSRPQLPGDARRRWPRTREFAADGLERSRLEISDVMIKHQLRLADRQCRMAELSQRLQDLVVILATSLWAGRQSSELVQAAADILCQDLTRQAHRQAADRRRTSARSPSSARRSPTAGSRPSRASRPRRS